MPHLAPTLSYQGQCSSQRAHSILDVERSQDSTQLPYVGTRPHPWLAYPHIGHRIREDDMSSLETDRDVGHNTSLPLSPSESRVRISLKDKSSATTDDDSAYSTSSSPRKTGLEIPNLIVELLNLQKKVLVIGGIKPEQSLKIERLLQWCLAFGEVSRCARCPNGDLHISFRSTEVADTVCRVRSRVCIPQVGSVQMSWFNGSKSLRDLMS